MHQLLLSLILLGAALPVAVGLIHSLGLLLALIFIQIFTQVQDSPARFLQESRQKRSGDSAVNMEMSCCVLLCFAYLLSHQLQPNGLSFHGNASQHLCSLIKAAICLLRIIN